jgi:hypothetical protein
VELGDRHHERSIPRSPRYRKRPFEADTAYP